MPNADTIFSFPFPHQNVLQREVANTVKQEVRRNGELVEPTLAGSTFSLFDPGGTAVIDAQAITIVDLVATFAIAAVDLPDTLPFSMLYQERWDLVLPDGTTRTIRRESAVAPFLLYPTLAEQGITRGRYPDLVNELGDDFTTLQPFMDTAWTELIEWLFEQGQWPDQMLSTAAFRRPHREGTLFLVFAHLFRQTSGNNRWERLMDRHESRMNAARTRLTSRLDYDNDGLPDDDSRQAASTVIHRNASFNRGATRNPRF